MEAMRLNTVIERGGEIHLTGLPLPTGQRVELIVLIESKREGVAETKAEYDAWVEVTAVQFLAGYDEADAIYDNYDKLKSAAD
jgi:hypothetical protein